jgi:hypothetical protein
MASGAGVQLHALSFDREGIESFQHAPSLAFKTAIIWQLIIHKLKTIGPLRS